MRELCDEARCSYGLEVPTLVKESLLPLNESILSKTAMVASPSGEAPAACSLNVLSMLKRSSLL